MKSGPRWHVALIAFLAITVGSENAASQTSAEQANEAPELVIKQEGTVREFIASIDKLLLRIDQHIAVLERELLVDPDDTFKRSVLAESKLQKAELIENREKFEALLTGN